MAEHVLGVPDSLEAEDGLVVLNPGAVGDPDESPQVWVGADLMRLLTPCPGESPRSGYCGGVNGYHAGDCPLGG